MFIDRDAKDPKSEIPSQTSIQAIHEEIVQLRRAIEDAMNNLPKEKK